MYRWLLIAAAVLFSLPACSQDNPETYLTGRGLSEEIVDHTMVFENRILPVKKVLAYFSKDGDLFFFYRDIQNPNAVPAYRYPYFINYYGRLCYIVNKNAEICGYLRKIPNNRYVYVRLDNPLGPFGVFSETYAGDSWNVVRFFAEARAEQADKERRVKAQWEIAKYAIGVGAVVIAGWALKEALTENGSSISKPRSGRQPDGSLLCIDDWTTNAECIAEEMLRRNAKRLLDR